MVDGVVDLAFEILGVLYAENLVGIVLALLLEELRHGVEECACGFH